MSSRCRMPRVGNGYLDHADFQDVLLAPGTNEHRSFGLTGIERPTRLEVLRCAFTRDSVWFSPSPRRADAARAVTKTMVEAKEPAAASYLEWAEAPPRAREAAPSEARTPVPRV